MRQLPVVMLRHPQGLHMSWKIELGALTLALGTAAVFSALSQFAPASTVPQAATRFTDHDSEAFDRDFAFEGGTCDVGVRNRSVCFRKSPLTGTFVKGEPLPRWVPDSPAEFSVILNTDLKASGLSTYRFGQTLVLIDRKSRNVVDVLDLAASAPRSTGTMVVADSGTSQGAMQ